MPFFTGIQIDPETKLNIELSVKDIVDILDILCNTTPYYKKLGDKLFELFEQEIRDKL